MSKTELCDKLQQEARRATLLEAEVARLSDGLLEERKRNDFHRSLLGMSRYPDGSCVSWWQLYTIILD